MLPYISATVFVFGGGGAVSLDACSKREPRTRFLSASMSPGVVLVLAAGLVSGKRFFLSALLRCTECAESPDALVSLEDDSCPEEKICEGMVGIWAMWPFRKDHVSIISSSRAVLSFAAEPLLISNVSILPKAVLFCSKYFRHCM